MKGLTLCFSSLIVSFLLVGQSYSPTDNGSKVHFVIDNFGIGTGGDFTGLSGSIIFDPANLANANFDVSVDASTVNTDVQARDNHLRRTEYFDVKNYPKLSFKSTRVTKTNKDGYFYMFGNITIKGVTKEVNFPFTATLKNGGYFFEGSFKLNRRDFNVGGNSIALSDELTVTLSIFANKN